MSGEAPDGNSPAANPPKATGSSWLAAHLSMTIPLLVFIGVLIYVLMQFPSPKRPSGNTGTPVWTNPPAGNQNIPANQNAPPSNDEANKPAPDTNRGP
ncbi:MAG: hypothetical protein HUU29_06595 [Planctomycetaceae bacterium]|nr:hypothetical protein [Planctomycetaceae bacterium]